MKPRAYWQGRWIIQKLTLAFANYHSFGVRICSRADYSTGLGSFRFTYEIPVGTFGVWKEEVGKRKQTFDFDFKAKDDEK